MKDNNKNTTRRKYTFRFVFFMSLAVIGGIPILITMTYPEDKIPSSVDMLMYFGTTASGFATLIAVFIAFDKEKDRREEEKKSDARVFIVMEPYIMFSDFDEFREYSHNADISKLYYFHEWISDEDKELQWIMQSKKSNLTQRNIMAAFIVANPTDRPIFDVSIIVEVEIVPTNNGKHVEGQITIKEYEPINFPVLLQQSKIAFILPIIKKTQHLARYVKITYMTQMNEEMCYDYGYFSGEDSIKERYYVGDEDLLNSDKKPSPFYDLRRWDMGRRV